MDLKEHLAKQMAIISSPEYREGRIAEIQSDPNSMSNWYPALVETGVLTPRTVLVPIDYDTIWDFMEVEKTERTLAFAEALKEAAKSFSTPFFLRSSITSAKHSWKRSCFVEDASALWEHTCEIIQFHGVVDAPLPSHFAIRELLPTSPFFHAFHGDMPITRERRYFIQDGKVVCHHPYWPEEAFLNEKVKSPLDALNFESDTEIATLTKLSEQVARAFPGYWSVDWLYSGYRWYCIDMALGSSSYHWKGCNVLHTTGSPSAS